MREFAILHGYSNDDPLIIWLWEILEEYTEVERASFLFFISGFIIFSFKKKLIINRFF